MNFYVIVATRASTGEFLTIADLSTDYEDACQYVDYLYKTNMKFTQLHEFNLENPCAHLEIQNELPSDDIEYSIVTVPK